MHAKGVPGTRPFSTVEVRLMNSVAGIPPSGRLRVPVANRTDSPSSPAGLWVKREKDFSRTAPPTPLVSRTGGAAAVGSGGQRPPRGSIRRRSVATEDRGNCKFPAG